jgi:hypothetical protein
MDLRQASGVPLPATDIPAGTISVRVVRGSFANNLTGVDVAFDVNGSTRTIKTDGQGRAEVEGLPAGASVQASTTVDGEHLETQPITVGSTGIRFVLVASSPGGAGAVGAGAAAAEPAVPARTGTVVLGRGSRIIADYSNERLSIYYSLEVVNASAAPVDTGGPLVVDLPSSARSATVMAGSTPQATASGSHVTVTGPFASGTTTVNIAFELPFSGATARVEQKWPVQAQSFAIFALKSGDIDLSSAQISSKQSSVQQGQALVLGLLPALEPGQPLEFEVTGLPHHAVWPRYLALAAAGIVTSLGVWAAFGPTSRRSA